MDFAYGVIEWGLRLLLWIVVALMVAATLLLARDQVLLDRHGQRTEAVVTGVTAGFRGPGSLNVTFEFGGRTRSASVEQSFLGGDWHVGDKAAIDFDPTDPSRARLAGTNSLLELAAFVLVLAAFVVLTYVIERGWKRKKQRRADRSLFPHEIDA